MNPEEILAAAKAAPSKTRLEEYWETVQTLREKGYTWREIADFLKERGVEADHTRIYRTFGKAPKQRRKESRAIQISKVTYIGEHKSKKNNTWNVLELLLPSKLNQPIAVIGYAWGKGGTNYIFKDDKSMSYRNATLVVKSGEGFPMAYVKLEIQLEGSDNWASQEVYIMPKWEALI